jgi:hypothetical protein
MSADGLLASSESEYEERSESESESESDNERREGRCASASQGGNSKKASDYAKGTPRENEGRRVVEGLGIAAPKNKDLTALQVTIAEY